MSLPVQIIYAGTAVLCSGIAAVQDLRERRISNLLTGPAILVGLLLHLTLGGLSQLGWSLLAGLAGGCIFLLFYMAGGMGAGDVKLMTAVGCIVGISSIKDVLLSTVIVGGVFAVAMALFRGRLRETVGNVFTLIGHHQVNGLRAHPELNVTNRSTLRLPYALPISMGCLFALFLSLSGGAAR